MNSSGLKWSVFTRGMSVGGAHESGSEGAVSVCRGWGGAGGAEEVKEGAGWVGGWVPGTNCAPSLADHFHRDS